MVIRGQWRRRRYGASLHGLQPGDEDCQVGVTRQARKHLYDMERRRQHSPPQRQTENIWDIAPRPGLDEGTGLPLPPCPAFLFSNLTSTVVPSQD